MLDFDTDRKAPAPRDAATVLVIRDHDGALEAFCVRRHAKSGFLGGAVVFPGGKVDPADGSQDWSASVSGEPSPRLALVSTESASPLALVVAACREAFEEARIVPLSREVSPSELDAIGARAKEVGFRAALVEAKLELAVDTLVPFARWVTPEAESRRFDARFFVLRLPEGQLGKHDDHETTHSFWAPPSRVLELAAKGELFLAPPTSRSLELLADARDVADALAVAGRQSLGAICPRFVAADPPFLALPGDPEHELAKRRVDGPTRYVLRDGRFVAENPKLEGAS